MAKLLIKKDDKLVKKISIHGEVLAFTVGSEPGNDIIIKDPSVSLYHVQFEKQDHDYYVRDLQSEWGTFVNGRKITSRTLIKQEDEIGIGNHNIIFLNGEISSSDEMAKPAPSDHTTESKENGKHHPKPELTNSDSWGEGNDLDLEQEVSISSDGPTNGHGRFAVKMTSEADPRLSSALGEGDSAFQTRSPDLLGNNELDYTESSFEIESEYYLDNPNFADGTDDAFTEETPGEPEQTIEETKDYYLVGIYGYYHGRKFQIRRPETRIGRNAKINDIVIRKNSRGQTDPSVSRRQATITYENQRYFLTDKRSKSRTRLNRTPLDVEDKLELNLGDEIEVISDRKNHIFRMVEKNHWDFSFPRKAGSWHIRFRTAMLNAYAILFVLVGAILIGKALVNHNKASEQPDPLTVQESLWYQTEEAEGLAEDSEIVFESFPVVADVNDDRLLDLVYIDRSGLLQCVNGASREILWRAEDFEADPSIPLAIEDLNKDGRLDVVAVSKDMRLRAIDGVWGLEIWQSPILAGPMKGAPIVSDLNKDGFNDVAVASEQNAVHIGYSDVRSAHWTTVATEEPVSSIATASEGAADGNPQLLVSTQSGLVLIIDGLSKQIVRTLDVNEELSKADGNYFNDQIHHPVAFADVDGDLTKDLVIYTSGNNLISLDGKDFKRLWFSTDSKPQGSIGTPARMALGDLDGDHLLDIITITPHGELRALKGTGDSQGRGFELWVKPVQNEASFVGRPVVADFNNNGTQDVLTSNQAGAVFILEGATGETLWRGSLRPSMLGSAPVVADFDQDNLLDVVFTTSSSKIYKLQTNRFIAKDAIVWQQPYGNNQRTGYSDNDNQAGAINYAYVSPVFLLSISVISLHLVSGFRRKRLSQLHIM